MLAGGAADWAGVKLANPPFTAGAALAGVLDIGNREPVKLFSVFQYVHKILSKTNTAEIEKTLVWQLCNSGRFLTVQI